MKEQIEIMVIFILGLFIGSFVTYQIDMEYINNNLNIINIIEEEKYNIEIGYFN